ncbi:MAG: hypothetical protein RIB98_08230 [Acidimicrobiales bacterium]
MTNLLKIATALLSVVLLAGACGDDDGGGGNAAPSDSPLVQAIADDMMDDEGSLTADRSEAECFASNVVGTVGEDRLNELGVTAADVGDIDGVAWTQSEAETIVDGMFSCIDMGESFVDDMDFGELDSEQEACIRGIFTEDVLKGFFVSSLTGDDEAGAGIFALMGEVAGCGIELG